jgi:adenylate kinase family enzyme
MRRVSVVGNAGSGKTLFARRLADVLGVPHIELDAIHHLPGWEPIDAESFLSEVDTLTSEDGWVVDGNYRTVVVDGPVWRRADTVVWIDLPRPIVMSRIITRTLRRVARREELWNGNREPLRNLYAWDPYKSIIRWSWTQHSNYQRRFSSAMSSLDYAHLQFVRLRSRTEMDHWLTSLDDGAQRRASE